MSNDTEAGEAPGPDTRIYADYLIETGLDPADAAEAMAGESSTGTFVQISGETAQLREHHRARVESVSEIDASDDPALPGALGAVDRFRRAQIRLSWPLANTGASLPAVLATTAGNVAELRELSGVRLLDLELPEAFAAHAGPRFGVSGTRQLVAVEQRPIIGTIVKPSVGLSPDQTAELVRTLALAGIDFIKDDELIADPPYSPLPMRVNAVTRAIEETADRTGRRVMYAFNITDDLEAMKRHADAVERAGGTCLMVSVHAIGIVALADLRRSASLPIHGHRNGFAMVNRYPRLGIEFSAFQKLWRLAGVDHLHVNGLQSKFWEPDESVVRSVRACLKPIFHDSDRVLPVLSSGQWGGQAPETFRKTQTTDLLYLAGGGILAHPDGPAAGVNAIRQAWDAAVAGESLDSYALHHPELAHALARFRPSDQ
jgi:ribulose-bisphosphate carboxylase large chain